jgi:hypothetical protein
MADSVTGVPVFTLAELKTAGAGANQIGGILETTIVGGNVVATKVVRDRWNQYGVVAVADAPNDGGDGLERAIYVSKSLNNVWRRQKATIGSFDGNENGPHFVIPE